MKNIFIIAIIIISLFSVYSLTYALPSADGPGLPTSNEMYGNQTLKRGISSDFVKQLQYTLIGQCGGGASIIPDGKFGLKTEIAVKKFQQTKNLKNDGIVGNSTKTALWQCAIQTM